MDGDLAPDHRPRYAIRQALAAIVVSLSVIGAINLLSDGDGGSSVDLAPAKASTATVGISQFDNSSASGAPGIESSTIEHSGESTAVPAAADAVVPPTATIAGTTIADTIAARSAQTVTIAAPAGLPAVDATAFAVYDATSDAWLAERQPDTPVPVGSVMKLLTAYVVLQAGDLTKVVTVPDLQLDIAESAIGLYKGEQLPRDVLLRAMLIVSANDAARALAIDIGGSTEGFVQQMNTAAVSLGLSNTVAANPIGLDAAGAHSSAHDMVTLAAVLLQDQTFREAVARTSANLHGQTFAATNTLLTAYAGATGVKTGHTTDAGYCLIGSATRDGRTMIVAVLGAPTEQARLAGATALLDWAFEQG